MPETIKHYTLRLYLAAGLGWLCGAAWIAGFVTLFFYPAWGGRLMALGSGFLAASMEVEPRDSRPWWMKAGLTLLAALGAFIP